MKLTEPIGGGYDPETKTLRIVGMKGTQEETVVDIEIPDKDVFIGWLSSIMFGFADDSVTGAGMVAHDVQIAFSKNDLGGASVIFLFQSGPMRMQFGVPMTALDPARLKAIQLHFDQALKEMGMPDAVHKQ